MDPTLSTNCLIQQFVLCATVGPIKGGAKELTEKIESEGSMNSFFKYICYSIFV